MDAEERRCARVNLVERAAEPGQVGQVRWKAAEQRDRGITGLGGAAGKVRSDGPYQSTTA
ncbi:hypothetical protein [Microbispora sp. NPDC049633]|uniref:hypothetical protein n=1 Tax=Microbispora sp. NPDC049633 TaxID=3154355 RepID=UPI00341BC5B1